METQMRKTAIPGDLEPGESTVCTTLKTRFHSFALVVFAILLSFLLLGCGGGRGDDAFTGPGAENGEQPGNGGEILTVTGSGSRIVPFTVERSGADTFELTHSGEGNFIVWLRDSDAERLALLANKIGDVSDTRVENLEQGDYSLDIDSTGAWSVSIAGAVSNGQDVVDEDGEVVVIPDVRVLASSGETLSSADRSTLRMSALVLGEGNRALAEVPVRFELPGEDNISWSPLEGAAVNAAGFPLTESSGRVEVRLRLIDDPRNQIFTVKAVVGALSGWWAPSLVREIFTRRGA